MLICPLALWHSGDLKANAEVRRVGVAQRYLRRRHERRRCVALVDPQLVQHLQVPQGDASGYDLAPECLLPKEYLPTRIWNADGLHRWSNSRIARAFILHLAIALLSTPLQEPLHADVLQPD